MAVGFFVDDGEEHHNNSYHTQVIRTNSATQTPLQSPVSREYLVQAFCEALERCSIAGKYKRKNKFFEFFYLCLYKVAINFGINFSCVRNTAYLSKKKMCIDFFFKLLVI